MKTLIYAIRFLARSKAYTIINLLGLAFSLACCIILMRYGTSLTELIFRERNSTKEYQRYFQLQNG